MTTQEFAQKFTALNIHEKFNNFTRIQQEFNKNKDKLNPEIKNAQNELIKWMRNTIFEDDNFVTMIPKN